jgi:hypothetical protein
MPYQVHFLHLALWIVLALLALGRTSAMLKRRKVKMQSLAHDYMPRTGQSATGLQARRVGALAQDWPSIRPDLQVRRPLQQHLRLPIPAWSQENSGPLTDKEIDALTAYILSWQTGPLPDCHPAGDGAARYLPGADVRGSEPRRCCDQNCEKRHGANLRRIKRPWRKTGLHPARSAIKETISNGLGDSMLAFSQARKALSEPNQ